MGLLDHNVNCIQKPLQIALFNKRSSEIRHGEIAHEHNSLIGQVDEHSIMGLAAFYRDQLNACPSDLQHGSMVNRDIRLEGT